MITTLGIMCIGIAAVMYLALGVMALAVPMQLQLQLLRGVGITVVGRAGRSEIRAVYGGFPLAVVTLGMPAGRIFSALLDRGIGELPMVFTVIELIRLRSFLWVLLLHNHRRSSCGFLLSVKNTLEKPYYRAPPAQLTSKHRITSLLHFCK